MGGCRSGYGLRRVRRTVPSTAVAPIRLGFVMLAALLSVLVLGFLLGMRHATDPDHVVAVTTIVAQQRSLARAARTGVLWGVGHTGTILLVGGAIVALKLQLSGIPARLGLSLELAVA